MIRWWPIYGLRKKLTEKKDYVSPVSLPEKKTKIFNRSLFVYSIDVGSSNALNFELSALESPQYNIHRYGIFMTDSPRHADLLLILGRPVTQMLGPLKETLSQIPEPFYTVTLDDHQPGLQEVNDYPELPNHIASLTGVPSPSEILGLLLEIAKIKKNLP